MIERFKRVVMDYYDKKNIIFYKSKNEFFNKKKGSRIILMTTKAKNSYSEFMFNKNDTILFGNESSGVPNDVHEKVRKTYNSNDEKKKVSKFVFISCNSGYPKIKSKIFKWILK